MDSLSPQRVTLADFLKEALPSVGTDELEQARGIFDSFGAPPSRASASPELEELGNLSAPEQEVAAAPAPSLPSMPTRTGPPARRTDSFRNVVSDYIFGGLDTGDVAGTRPKTIFDLVADIGTQLPALTPGGKALDLQKRDALVLKAQKEQADMRAASADAQRKMEEAQMRMQGHMIQQYRHLVDITPPEDLDKTVKGFFKENSLPGSQHLISAAVKLAQYAKGHGIDMVRAGEDPEYAASLPPTFARAMEKTMGAVSSALRYQQGERRLQLDQERHDNRFYGGLSPEQQRNFDWARSMPAEDRRHITDPYGMTPDQQRAAADASRDRRVDVAGETAATTGAVKTAGDVKKEIRKLDQAAASIGNAARQVLPGLQSNPAYAALGGQRIEQFIKQYEGDEAAVAMRGMLALTPIIARSNLEVGNLSAPEQAIYQQFLEPQKMTLQQFQRSIRFLMSGWARRREELVKAIPTLRSDEANRLMAPPAAPTELDAALDQMEAQGGATGDPDRDEFESLLNKYDH
jgi:hypothetical protein